MKNRLIFQISAKKLVTDSIVDCVLTRFVEFSIKNYMYSEISSSMENQLREHSSFGGVSLRGHFY